MSSLQKSKISALFQHLISTGIVSDGEVLRYCNRQGHLGYVGRLRADGIEVGSAGTTKILGSAAFEVLAGENFESLQNRRGKMSNNKKQEREGKY